MANCERPVACKLFSTCMKTFGSIEMADCQGKDEYTLANEKPQYCIHCDMVYVGTHACPPRLGKSPRIGKSLRVRLPNDFTVKATNHFATESGRWSSSERNSPYITAAKEPPMNITKRELTTITSEAKDEVNQQRLAEAKGLIKGKLVQIERAKSVVRNLELELEALKDQLVVGA